MTNNIPKHWQVKKLGEVCKFVRGPFGGSLKKENFKNDGFAVYEQQHAIYNQFSEIRYFIDEHKFNEMRRFELNSGDLIMSCSGTMGKISIVPKNIKKGIINQALLKLSPTNELSIVYLKMWMDSMTFQKSLKSFSKGAAIQNVASVSILKNIEIPLPPLPEQQAIVAKIEELFSELDKGVENLKIAQQQLKVYRQSLLKWAFEGKLTNVDVKDGELPKGWKIVTVGDVCNCIVPNRDKPKTFSGNIKWVTTPNLSETTIRLKYEEISLGLSEFEAKEYNARIIPIGGVIMTCVGTFGLSAIVERPIVINQQLHAFISNEQINAKYLAYLIQNSKHYFERISTSTTIQYLNKSNCNSMPLPLPSIEEQQLIVSELESKLTICDKMEETISQSLQQAETLRQSILKRAFEGKLINNI
jgi:type I restriction enzyme S subunit